MCVCVCLCLCAICLSDSLSDVNCNKSWLTICHGVHVQRVVKGGSRSRFTENKTVLSQFTKNKDIMKITVHGELNIYFSFHGK